jgi:hypothetical protein
MPFSSRIKTWFVATIVPAAVIVLGTLVSRQVPISAPVEIKAEVNRVSLTAADSEANRLLPHTAVCAIDLRGFKEITIPAASIRIADPARADWKTGVIPQNEWKPWPTNKGLVLRPSEPRFPAKVTLKPLTICGPGLSVDGIKTPTGEVVLASPEKDYLTVELHEEQQGSVALPNEFVMDAEYCSDADMPFPRSNATVRLRIALSPTESSFLNFASAHSGMFVQLQFAPGQMQKPVMSKFSIRGVDFTNQGPMGKPETTIIGPGMIRYYRKNIKLAAGDVLTAQQLRQFSVEVGAGPGEKSLSIHMKGLARVEINDQRPTLFDALTGDTTVQDVAKTVKAVRDIFK